MNEAQRTDWLVIALAVVTGALAATAIGKMPPALPLLRADLGLSMISAGWLASLISVTAACLGLFVGITVDRRSPVAALQFGLLALAAGAILGGLGGLWQAFLGRLIESVGFLIVAVTTPRFIGAAARPRDRGLAFGLWSMYMPLGMVAAMLAAPPLLTTLGWQGYWWLSAAIYLLFGRIAPAIMGRVLDPLEQATATVSAAVSGRATAVGGIRHLLGRPGPWVLAACFAFYTLPYFAVVTWLPTFLMESQKMSAASAASWTALVIVANIAGIMIASWRMHHGVRRTRLMALALSGIAVFGVVLFAGGTPDFLRLPAALALIGMGGMLPAAILAAGPDHAPSPTQVAGVNGIILQGANIGSLLGAPVLALTVTLVGGWDGVWMLLLASALAGLLTVRLLGYLEARDKG